MSTALEGVEPLDTLSESELLLRQTARFAQSQMAAALASVRIAASAIGTPEGLKLRSTLRQLEASSECLSLIEGAFSKTVRVDHSITQLCRALAQWRIYPGRKTMVLNLAPLMLDGETARRLHLITADLVCGAVRYGLERGGAKIEVCLDKFEGNVSLAVWADGSSSGYHTPCGAASYASLAAELVRRAGGSLSIKSDATGSTTIVTLPAHRRNTRIGASC